ncbi:MAG: hypothetical protein ACMUJM_20230 [bacterium]
MKHYKVEVFIVILCSVCFTAVSFLSCTIVYAQEGPEIGLQITAAPLEVREGDNQGVAIMPYSSYSNYIYNLPTERRTQAWYKTDVQTDPYGGTQSQWVYGPDVGMGEAGAGLSYTNPFTGATVNFSTTGYAMGTIAAPIYGGANSVFGLGTYGPLLQTAATGAIPQTAPNYGWATQTSQAGNLFGTGYSYSYAQPNLAMQVATQLTQNPNTKTLGYALLGLSIAEAFNAYACCAFQPYYGFASPQSYYGYPGARGYGSFY